MRYVQRLVQLSVSDLRSADGAMANRSDVGGVSGLFWLSMNWGRLWSTRTKRILTCVNVGVLVIGTVIVSASCFMARSQLTISQCVVGLYASINELAKGSGGKPFSCAGTE